MTDDMVAFIRACLKDEEAEALATLWDGSGNRPDWHAPFSATLDTGGDTIHIGDRYVTAHIARHDPARVLRDIAAKRAILDEHTECTLYGSECRTCAKPERPNPATPDDHLRLGIDHPCPTLRHLAAVYADRPGYQEEWKP